MLTSSEMTSRSGYRNTRRSSVSSSIGSADPLLRPSARPFDPADPFRLAGKWVFGVFRVSNRSAVRFFHPHPTTPTTQPPICHTVACPLPSPPSSGPSPPPGTRGRISPPPASSDAHFANLDKAAPDSLLNRLLKEAGDVPLALAAQAPLTEASSHSLALLTLYVSHFHQVYDLGVARGTFTAGGRAFYDREVGAAVLPDLSNAAAVLSAASKIAPGETKRQEKEGAAYRAMALPSAAEVAAIYAEVAALHRQSEVAQAFTAQQQNELAALYPEAQKLAVAICNTVAYHLENDEAYAHLDPSARRRIARLWGLVYIYDPTEPPDEGDTNAANTTLPPLTPTTGNPPPNP